MAADHYVLITTWRLNAPVAEVWQVLSDAGGWPTWWPFVESVELVAPGEAAGLHSIWRYTWKTLLPYRLRLELSVTRIEAPAVLEAEVTGDLSGYGSCRIFRQDPHTLVRYEWNVRTCRPWMKWFAPVARPVFLWNHQRVMQHGEAALAAVLAGNRNTPAS